MLFLRLGAEVSESLRDRIEGRIFNPVQLVVEVMRLPYHSLVAISTHEEVFIVSEEEFARQV